MMRSDKLGYNAPIEVYDRKYYRYSDEDYSISKRPLTGQDLEKLTEVVGILKQFKGFSHFKELGGMVQRLEDKVYSSKENTRSIIDLEKNEYLKGFEYIDPIYKAIQNNKALNITYQSFKAREASSMKVHGYILKEFNNRWFFVGKKHLQNQILTLALDRIIKIDFDVKTTYKYSKFDADKYYENTFGVTVLNDASLINIELKIDRQHAPYILTKPLHHSQQRLGDYADHSIKIGLKVHHNFEIERLLLGFGASIEVLKPSRLRRRIKSELKKAHDRYLK